MLHSLPEPIYTRSVSHLLYQLSFKVKSNQLSISKQAGMSNNLPMGHQSFRFKSGLLASLITGALVLSIVIPTHSSAQTWQCQLQIPKSGNISSWCGMSPVNLRISGSSGSGWIGMNPFNLRFSGNSASGWIGMEPVSLRKSGTRVSGWVGQNPVNCRISGRNNFCLTFIAVDSN